MLDDRLEGLDRFRVGEREKIAVDLHVLLERALAPIPHLPVSSLYLEGPSGDVFRMQSNGPAVVLIRRIEFDHLLTTLAMEAGAELVAPAAIAQAAQDEDGVTLALRDGRR